MSRVIHTNDKSVMAVVERFRRFLNLSWPMIAAILEKHDWDDDAYFLDDWLDANWKLLVARQLLGRNGDLQPFAVPTDDVLKRRSDYWLESLTERKIFISLGSGRRPFTLGPPFDMVKVMNQDGTIEVLPWLSVSFEIKHGEKGSGPEVSPRFAK